MNKEELKSDIIGICRDCLSIKESMLTDKRVTFSCYIGGGREYNGLGSGSYSRTIYLGRDSKRYTDIPEDLIDLNEVYFLYKRDKGFVDWEDNYFNSEFRDAVDDLAMGGIFLIVDYEGIIRGEYAGISYDKYIEARGLVASAGRYNIRFVRLLC